MKPFVTRATSPSRSLVATFVLVLVAACGGGEPEPQQTVQRNPLLRPDDFAETAPEQYTVTLHTSEGDVVIQVYREWAPLGADRFYNLAKNGYYDDARVYRVLPGFMAQFGLHADPYVTQAWKSEFLVDDPVVESNTRGRVAFAKGGRHTRTTEVFISYRDNSSLDVQDFAPFGEVVEGMDVVDAFYGEYGDGPTQGGTGPYQAMAAARGNAYLDEEFPLLTKILDVTVTPGG